MYNMGIFETEQSYHLRKRILLMIKCKKILKLSLKGFFFIKEMNIFLLLYKLNDLSLD